MRFSIGVFLLLLAFTSQAQLAPQSLDSLVQAEVERNQFSGIILLADNGTPIYRRAVGESSSDVAMTMETPMRLASITKAFTSVLIMQLIQDDLLRPETTIEDILPELEIKKAHKITVRDLLLHTSGLPNEPDGLYHTPHGPREMINRTLASQSYNKRGDFNYCNLDYMVLGLMIEKVTGKSWAEVLQIRILDPLDMTHTGIARLGMEDIAQGYISMELDGQEVLMPEPSFHIENFYAAGAMYGTVGDLLKFDQALYSGKLLHPETIDQMYTSHPELGYVAYGSWVYDYYFLPSSPRLVERRGGILGFNHTFIRMPEVNKTLVILSNNDRFNPDTFGQLDSFKDQLIAALVEE